MHLFAIGWGLSDELGQRLRDEVRRTARGFPHLDPDTHWSRALPGGVLATGITSSAEIIRPREYVHDDGDTLTVFDGLPLAPTIKFAAHRASELAREWERLPDILEGRFIAARIRGTAGDIEILNDPLGVGQLYVWESAGASIVSNSAGIVQRTIGVTEPDPLGVSMFLAMDWVGADRTLRRDVRVAPAGQRWRWRRGDRQWSRSTYWSVAGADLRPEHIMDDTLTDQVIDGLRDVVQSSAAVSGSINAPLTGGKDSRMLAAVLMSAGIDARYWTKGDAGSVDVSIALDIVERHGLNHRVANRPTQAEDGRDPTQDVAAEWESITREFVHQTDGLASIFLVGNIQGQPRRVSRLEVTLSAMCAESARAMYAQDYLCAPDSSVARIRRYMPYAETQIPRGLVSGEAYAAARRHVADWVDAADGIATVNRPAAFYLDERCRRWASNNPRELGQTEDKVLPFMTRPYVETVLALHPDERDTHQVHRRVIRRAVPDLEHDPPLDLPWHSEIPPRASARRKLINVVMAGMPYPARRALVEARERLRPTRVTRAPWSPYDEASWLEANLAHARDTILSRSRSPLLDYLNRPMLERLLDPTTAPDRRRLHQLPLFAAYTMFMYEALEAELANERR